MAMTLCVQFLSVTPIRQEYSLNLRRILLFLYLNDISYAAGPKINTYEHDH